VDEPEEKSAVIIPFPHLDGIVDTWRRVLDPAQRRGIPAHVTLLFPFADPADLSVEILMLLSDYFSRVEKFNVTFASTAWFDDRVVYLQPRPEQQFRTMTKQLHQCFPSYLPYGGKFADPIPHLTLGDGGPLESLRKAESVVSDNFPIETEVTEAWLMSGGMGPRSWSLRQSFPLKN
jgi:2'-5' RNA ligase